MISTIQSDSQVGFKILQQQEYQNSRSISGVNQYKDGVVNNGVATNYSCIRADNLSLGQATVTNNSSLLLNSSNSASIAGLQMSNNSSLQVVSPTVVLSGSLAGNAAGNSPSTITGQSITFSPLTTLRNMLIQFKAMRTRSTVHDDL